jgi:hypothetical protein
LAEVSQTKMRSNGLNGVLKGYAHIVFNSWIFLELLYNTKIIALLTLLVGDYYFFPISIWKVLPRKT